MKRWLKLTLLRLAGVFLLAVILWMVLIRIPENSARRTIKGQPKLDHQAASQLGSASEQLTGLPKLSDLTPRQSGSFRNYAGQLDLISKDIKTINMDGTCPGRVIGLRPLTSDANELISDSCGIYKSASRDLGAADNLATYSSKVCDALINILGYDAAADTADFSLSSSDTDQRLQLAAQGLAKTMASLAGLRGLNKTDSLAGIISIVSSLQQARDNLARTGDTSGWINSVNQAQAEIIVSRDSFWQKQTALIVNALNKDGDLYMKNQQAWSALASKYGI